MVKSVKRNMASVTEVLHEQLDDYTESENEIIKESRRYEFQWICASDCFDFINLICIFYHIMVKDDQKLMWNLIKLGKCLTYGSLFHKWLLNFTWAGLQTTVYKLLGETGVEYSARFTNIDDSHLDKIIAEIKETHPNTVKIIVMGHLRARNIRVQRNRVRASIHRVDPQGPIERNSRNFHPRVYDTPCPNYVWHLNRNHKLVKWGFVTHLGIDGFSRLIT